MLIIIKFVMINDVYINFRQTELMFAILAYHPYLTIFVLSLNYLISLISCHFLFKTSWALKII